MNTLFSILAHPLAETIGWTLVHSLWQGLVVVLLAKFALHYIPANRPNARYAVALSGLALIVAGGIVTASLLLPEQHDGSAVPSYFAFTAGAPTPEAPAPAAFIQEAARLIESGMPLILTLWMAGVLLLSLRLALGWTYITRLRMTASPVADAWRSLLEDLKKQLGLTAEITLAESNRLTTPAVIGIFKPVILVPVGMLTGLSQQQVEAVLLHELSHIRRHDFLINTLQSLVEILYFFNPFVWMLSSAARNEREYCCDDQVVDRYHPRVYAEALAYLETVRVNKPALAVSLTGETNNLLYRIQRFMEKSRRNNPVPQWMAPVVLAVAGIISMSWLTIGSDPAKDEASRMAHTQVAQSVVLPDTIGNPSEKRAVWSRKKTVIIGEDGEPHEEIVESFEGDEALRESMQQNFSLNFDFDTNWDLDSGAFAWLDSSDFTYDFKFDFDSMVTPDAFHFAPPIPPLVDSLPPFDGDVRAFREEFETMFKDKFSDFYEKHQEDLQKMMDRLQEKFDDDTWQENLERQMQDMQLRLQELMKEMKGSQLQEQTLLHQEALREYARQMRDMDRTVALQSRVHHEQMMAAHKQMQAANHQIQVVRKKHEAFKDALKSELIRDGYLDKDEPLRSIRWTNDDMEVNGMKVKPKDAKKYRKLNKKFLGE